MSVYGGCSQKRGDLIVIQITGCLGKYIAEIISEKPWAVRVEERGPYSRLVTGEFILNIDDSARLQGGDKKANALLREAIDRGHPLVSGLERLGVNDGKLHQILPTK